MEQAHSAVAVTEVTRTTSKAVKMSAPLAGLGIVVADDRTDLAAALQILLEGQGARVTACHDRAICLELVRGLRPDLLIVASGAADASGADIIRAVRRLPIGAGGAVPALWLTSDPDQEQATSIGFQRALRFASTRELVDAIRKLARPEA